jgi:hypothetical protein
MPALAMPGRENACSTAFSAGAPQLPQEAISTTLGISHAPEALDMPRGASNIDASGSGLEFP